MIKRVDNLIEPDSQRKGLKYNLVRELADKEDDFREDLKNAGIQGESLDNLADKYATRALEGIEGKRESRDDALTGLRNRRALEEEIPQILGLEWRGKRDCSVLMIDMDDFKKVNDTYGHQAGDQVLKELAQVIKSSIRSTDFSYRYGGEEFVIVLPDTDQGRAVHVAEKIRESIEEALFAISDESGQKRELKKTASIGCVSMNQIPGVVKILKSKDGDRQEALNELIRLADTAHYESKRGGKNRVTVYGASNHPTKPRKRVR